MRNAIFGFSTPNLGDDVQALAAALLLPRVDAYVDRERLDQVRLNSPHQIIMNSWFAIKRYTAVPSADLLPDYFGYCVGHPKIVNDAWMAEWQRRGPIGVRDMGSLAILRECGINAYYSGCLTTWMGRFIEPVARREGVVFLDVPDAMERFIPEPLRQRAQRLTNETPKGNLNILQRLRRTAEILDVLRRAELVVTRRLHTALPCVGFGTPVTVYLESNAPNRHRFSGADRLVPVVLHDGRQPLEGTGWAEPKSTHIPNEMEENFQALLERLGTKRGPRCSSMVAFVETLPDAPRYPRRLIDQLRVRRSGTRN